jgi:serine/threonine protein phosphatase PrpC
LVSRPLPLSWSLGLRPGEGVGGEVPFGTRSISRIIKAVRLGKAEARNPTCEAGMILVQSHAISIRNRQRADKPNEDDFKADDLNRLYLVADGVTSTPNIGDPYPDPAGGQLAARAFCEHVHAHLLAHIAEVQVLPVVTLRNALAAANDAIRELNLVHRRYIEANFADKDYIGTVGALAAVVDERLYVLHIGDVMVVMVRNGHLELITDIQTENIRTYRRTMKSRGVRAHDLTVSIRRDFRNNLDAKGVDGQPVGYGVLTGEKPALDFVKDTMRPLKNGDKVLILSDGFQPLIRAALQDEAEMFKVGRWLEEGSPALEKMIGENERFETSLDDKSAILISFWK